MNQLFAESSAASWNLSPNSFAAALSHSAAKHFAQESPPAAHALEQYFRSLNLRDLALACACAEGCPAAWEYFVSAFQPYLRSAAGAVLRCPPDSPASRELADSLFADLYGMGEPPQRRSLFRYFHGRSSLKTWLRAVLAQRHVDAIRANRRFTELDPDNPDGQAAPSTLAASASAPRNNQPTFPADPHRAALLAHFHRALQAALALLDPRDKERLRLYYAAGHTLAEIGRQLGEHESSVSRHLDRARRELRLQVEQHLRTGFHSAGAPSQPGLSDAQITLCFQYAAEDPSIDLDHLLPSSPPAPIQPASKKT